VVPESDVDGSGAGEEAEEEEEERSTGKKPLLLDRFAVFFA